MGLKLFPNGQALHIPVHLTNNAGYVEGPVSRLFNGRIPPVIAQPNYNPANIKPPIRAISYFDIYTLHH